MYKVPANTLFMGQKLIYVPECHSTNSSLAELIAHGDLPEGLVLLTDHQTKGMGQRGNSWESGQGMNLTLSVLLKPKFLAIKDQFQLNMAIAIGIAAGLKRLVSRTISLKWPNDIFIDDKKVGGILIQNQSQGGSLAMSIVGIGVNINQLEFTAPQATSLIEVTGKSMPLDDVFQHLISALEATYLELRAGHIESIRGRYIQSMYRYGQLQSFESEGQRFVGMITDVDEFGRLCIKIDSSIRKFSLKEIKMLNKAEPGTPN